MVVCKTVRQYSDGALPGEEIRKLLEIARDYQTVKNYVYRRYGGVGSLGKLYPLNDKQLGCWEAEYPPSHMHPSRGSLT